MRLPVKIDNIEEMELVVSEAIISAKIRQRRIGGSMDKKQRGLIDDVLQIYHRAP